MGVVYDKILGELREGDSSGGASYGPDVSRYSGHYIGEIIEWPAATPPAHCLVCDGSLVSRTTYAALFAVVGTTYGEGDGSTTFALPDRRGRFGEGVPQGGTVGTEIAAGLPDIAGRTRAIIQTNATSGVASTPMQGEGAFGPDTSLAAAMTYFAPAGTATTERYPWAVFAASRSDSIYGNSQTVQPLALTQLYVIVAE